jgi:Co/Zn/Cd efflux system component
VSGCCESGCSASARPDPRFRRVLWIALVVNAAMFAVELGAGLRADSASLLADAADFLGDAANYAVSLFVLALAPVWRSRAAALKGASMGVYGVAVLAVAGYNLSRGALPNASAMGAIGFLALLANLGVAALLYRFRSGDANMRSVWLCTRNDAIGNVAVMLAALGVFGTGAGWPDLIVAAIMATLALTAARQVLRQAGGELGWWPAQAESALSSR